MLEVMLVFIHQRDKYKNKSLTRVKNTAPIYYDQRLFTLEPKGMIKLR